MKLTTYKEGQTETAAILDEGFVIPLDAINRHFDVDFGVTMSTLLAMEQIEDLNQWWRKQTEVSASVPEAFPVSEVQFAPLYRNPSKIWGIGLNYVDHATDLNEVVPNDEPASFMKPTTTIIGSGDEILLPHQSQRTTGEAELGIVIGKRCRDVEESDALSVVAGFTTIIDMTAEDILAKNPRYLTRSKSFDTFFSFGPSLVTPDEVENLADVEVATILNGKLHRKNVIANMAFSPEMLISFHSKVMTLEAGDIISTGTPGAVHLQDGDQVTCEINGFPGLTNSVRDLKK